MLGQKQSGLALVGFMVSELLKDSLETKRDGDSENPMKQNCSQLGEHGQLNRTNDWPLMPNLKKPAGTVV